MKGNTSLITDMEKLGPLGQALECAVCLDMLNSSSRVLPCQHTFCESCLIDIINSHTELRCPECRTLVTIPLRDLPPNILLKRVLESMKTLPPSMSKDKSSVIIAKAVPFSVNTEVPSNSDVESLLNLPKNQTIPIIKEPLSLQNQNAFLTSNCTEASSIPLSIHNFTSVNSQPRLNSNPVSFSKLSLDASSVDHSCQIDYFPTDFSCTLADSNSVYSTSLINLVSNEQNALNTTPTNASRDASLSFNPSLDNQLSSSTFSSIDTSQEPSIAPTSVALMEHCAPSFMEDVNQVCENRRKTINFPIYNCNSDTLPSSSTREGRGSLSRNFTKSKFLLNTLATALYSYSQKESWDLSFKKGDVITIMQKVDANWYQGKLNGQIGFIPSSYVKVQDSPTNIPQCIALFDFKISAKDMEGLSFHKGDTITVLRRIDENWAEGKFGLMTGIFPLSFVEMNEAARSLLNSSLINPTEALPIIEKSPQARSPSLYPDLTTHLIDIGMKTIENPPAGESQNNVYECIHPHKPSEEDELQLSKGSIHSVTENCKDGLFKGHSLITDNVGDFPGNYVTSSSGEKMTTNFILHDRQNSKNTIIKEKIDGNKLLVNDFNNCVLSPNCSKPSSRYSSHDKPSGSKNITPKTESINKPKRSKHNVGRSDKKEKPKDSKIFRQPAPLMRERFRCVVPYPPSNRDELQLRQGDVVYVHRKMDDGWFKGTLQRSGEAGLFPSTFVEPY